MKKRWVALSLALALSAHAPALFAQDGAQRANELIDAGVALRAEGEEAEALERFRAAYAIVPSARALGQMGLAAKSLRLYVDAERYLEEALAADDPWVQDNREALELALDVVRKQLASLMVTSNAIGAELVLNGKVVGTLPLSEPLRTLAGAAIIEVRLPGRPSSVRQMTLPYGETTTLHIEVSSLVTPQKLPEEPPQPVAEAPSALLWIGTGLAVLGTAGIVIGISYGVRTLSLKDDRDAVCPPNDGATCPTLQGVELDAEAREAATISTAALILGGLHLAAGIAVFAVELAPNPAKVTVGPGYLGVEWRL